MRVLIDTPIWSLAYRRTVGTPRPADTGRIDTLRELLGEGRAVLLGLVRQEVLQGIPKKAQFEQVRADLDELTDEPIWGVDHTHAAQLFNRCRAAGVQATTVDMLLCAVAQRLKGAIFTLDRDFVGYSRVLGVKVFGPHVH